MTKRRSAGRRRRTRFAILAVLGAAALITSACAGAGSAAAGGTKKQRMQVSAIAYAECMRSHNVPGFPDPASGGNFSIPDTISGSPQYRSADQACRHLLPITPMSPAEQARELARGRKYSACMRAHGLPGFPDPTVNAQGVNFIGAGGPHPDSAQYQAAQRACVSQLTGGQ